MAATRAYAPETMPLYGVGSRMASPRMSTSYRAANRATASFNSAPTRTMDRGYGSTDYPFATSARMASSRPEPRAAARQDYWAGSTAPDFAYWDGLSSEAYAWEEAVPAPAPATRTRSRSFSAAPATKTQTRTATRANAAARPARKPAAPAPKPVMESVWETRDEAVTAFNALPTHVVLAIVTAIFIVALAVVSYVRIGWNADTVLVQMSSEELSQTITSTRLAGRLLEVQRGSMVTASRIRVEALYRGMMEPDSTESLVLKPDTIVVDEEGNLSLAGSIARVAEAATAS